MTYEEFLGRLQGMAEEDYRTFHSRLIKDERVRVLGVRMPRLRALAKELKGEWREVLAYPAEPYETVVVQCAVLGMQPYEIFAGEIDGFVSRLDNWAVTDTFTAPCILKNRENFLPHIRNFLKSGRPFTVRYGLVCLMKYYLEPAYREEIERALEGLDFGEYYISTAAAWLTAEMAAADFGESLKLKSLLDETTARRAVRKVKESFRLTPEEKAAFAASRNFSQMY